MSRAMKPVKAPITDGFLLSDIRTTTDSSFRKLSANSMKTTKSVFTLLTAAILVFSFLITDLPSGGRSVLAKSNKPKPTKSDKRITDDLQDLLNNPVGTSVQVVIDTKASPNSQAYANLLTRISQLGGTVVRRLSNGKHVAARIPISAILTLANDNAVKRMSLDKKVQVMGHLETTTGAHQARSLGNTFTGTINGTGIGIAILDSGVYAEHHSFGSRVVASVDFTGEGRTDDPFGHGSHVASSAAGSNHVSGGAYTGIAPGAKIINVRVLNSQGQGVVSDTIAGIDWCIANKALYNIRVLNLSLGATAADSADDDPLCQAVRRAFDAGLVVCAAAGNSGKDAAGNKVYGSVHSPGIEPSAITVGAANTFGTNSRSDDGVASYSSRGPTRGYYTDTSGVKQYDNIIKPDLVAPGNKIIEVQSPNNALVSTNPGLGANVSSVASHKMMRMSGTSMATPVVAGAAALILQRNPHLTPNLVKAILEYSSQPLAGFNTLEQGAGELNVEGAVRLAGLIRTDLLGLPSGQLDGLSLLVGPAPTQSTTIGGSSFVWGAGIIQRWNFIYGSNLILQYQGIYGAGTLLCDGVLLSDGTLLADRTLLADGTLLSDGVLLADGTLLADGVLLSDGTLLADGVLLSDGTLLADGVLLSDCFLEAITPPPIALAMAQAALDGDLTTSMTPVLDSDPVD